MSWNTVDAFNETMAIHKVRSLWYISLRLLIAAQKLRTVTFAVTIEAATRKKVSLSEQTNFNF